MLDEFLNQAFIFGAESLFRAARLFPKERLVAVSFDRLTEDALATLECADDRLNLGEWSGSHT